MKHHLVKSVTKSLYILMLSLVVLFSQLSFADLQLGNMGYGRIQVPNLVRTVSRGDSFFRDVGGVAFEAVATGEKGLEIKSLHYDPTALDGNRLKLILTNGKGDSVKVTGSIYDWQLVPVALFADSSFGSAMTLFGEASDKKIGEEILKTGGRIINYHEEFEDTLVGLRLFQADILILQPNSVDLFKTKAGKYILGAGEVSPDLVANKARFEKMSETLEMERSKDNTYSSYVVGDLGQQITFRVKGKELEITGAPYWWMWDNPKQYKRDREVERAFWIKYELSKLESITSPSQTSYLIYAKEVLDAFEDLDAFNKEDGDWEAFSKRLQAYKVGEVQVEHKYIFSGIVSRKVAELDGINPTVYQTLKTVMHYAALFRHAKQVNAKGYASFLNTIKNIQVLPVVETPNVQYGVVH